MNKPATPLTTDNPATSTEPTERSVKPSAPFTVADFDFTLPPELIAQHPAHERSASRLLDGTDQQPINRTFCDIAQCLRAGDLLVFNDTKVVKARLYGEKPSGGKLEMLVERVLPDESENGLSENSRIVAAHMKASKKPPIGTVLNMQGGFTAKMLGRWPDENSSLFKLEFSDDPYTLMKLYGHVPLPPYIEHSDTAQDQQRYQAIFAREPGAVAAPTAALHFDELLLAELQHKGIEQANITLHVGTGTFAPVKVENIAEHQMHFERYEVPVATINAIRACKKRGERIVAVGTTSVRALESWAKTGLTRADTNIFITPGFQFQVVDMLITNFHLPKSTLMMLVSAFAGYNHIKALYTYAIHERYRFFSYGDSMLLKKS